MSQSDQSDPFRVILPDGQVAGDGVLFVHQYRPCDVCVARGLSVKDCSSPKLYVPDVTGSPDAEAPLPTPQELLNGLRSEQGLAPDPMADPVTMTQLVNRLEQIANQRYNQLDGPPDRRYFETIATAIYDSIDVTENGAFLNGSVLSQFIDRFSQNSN